MIRVDKSKNYSVLASWQGEAFQSPAVRHFPLISVEKPARLCITGLLKISRGGPLVSRCYFRLPNCFYSFICMIVNKLGNLLKHDMEHDWYWLAWLRYFNYSFRSDSLNAVSWSQPWLNDYVLWIPISGDICIHDCHSCS